MRSLEWICLCCPFALDVQPAITVFLGTCWAFVITIGAMKGSSTMYSDQVMGADRILFGPALVKSLQNLFEARINIVLLSNNTRISTLYKPVNRSSKHLLAHSLKSFQNGHRTQIHQVPRAPPRPRPRATHQSRDQNRVRHLPARIQRQGVERGEGVGCWTRRIG